MSIIYICGFMGCGKSTLGPELSRVLGYDYLDLDCHIETKYKMKIADMFEQKGEEYFRNIESDELKIVGEDNIVIATGGGTFISEENVLIAKEKGVIIYIDTPFKECYRRIKNDKSRPLVKTFTFDELSTIYTTREAFYKKICEITVKGDCALNEIVDDAVMQIMLLKK